MFWIIKIHYKLSLAWSFLHVKSHIAASTRRMQAVSIPYVERRKTANLVSARQTRIAEAPKSNFLKKILIFWRIIFAMTPNFRSRRRKTDHWSEESAKNNSLWRFHFLKMNIKIGFAFQFLHAKSAIAASTLRTQADPTPHVERPVNRQPGYRAKASYSRSRKIWFFKIFSFFEILWPKYLEWHLKFTNR